MCTHHFLNHFSVLWNIFMILTCSSFYSTFDGIIVMLCYVICCILSLFFIFYLFYLTLDLRLFLIILFIFFHFYWSINFHYHRLFPVPYLTVLHFNGFREMDDIKRGLLCLLFGGTVHDVQVRYINLKSINNF
jgi:hypothetical protein